MIYNLQTLRQDKFLYTPWTYTYRVSPECNQTIMKWRHQRGIRPTGRYSVNSCNYVQILERLRRYVLRRQLDLVPRQSVQLYGKDFSGKYFHASVILPEIWHVSVCLFAPTRLKNLQRESTFKQPLQIP